jgi:Xaa-Pro dipeptidase
MPSPDLRAALLEADVAKELAFPAAEYAGRIARARAEMEKRDLDVIVVTTTVNACYLTGYETHMSPAYVACILPRDGEVVIETAETEVTDVLHHSVADDVVVFNWMKAATTADSLGNELKERGFGSAKIGLELSLPENFASGAYDTASYLRLAEVLPDASFEDVTPLLMELRLIKSAREIEYMRKAGDYTWAALQGGIEATRMGGTENDVIAGAYAAGIGAGSELMSIQPMTMTGPRTGLMPHLMFRRKTLEPGDLVYMEFTGTYWRYNAPGMRTTSVGRPNAKAQKISDVTIEALLALQSAIRPGRTGNDIAAEVSPLFDQIPGAWFHGAFGYSIGMGFHPTWTECPVYIAEGADRELEESMCFHLPINPFYPGEGPGVGYSESIVVTADGCETLTPGRALELIERR